MPAQSGLICNLPSRILLATDLTDLKQILPEGIDYALSCKAVLKLIHVMPDVSIPGSSPPQGLPDGRQTARQHAERVLEEASKQATDAGVKSTWIVYSGLVTSSIMQVVQEWKADRLVIGTHGQRKFQQELLGSIAESILREVSIPVMAIGPAVRRGGLLSEKRRILLATALDRRSRAISESIARFARSHHADLAMLHVIPEIAETHPSALRIRVYAESRFREILSHICEDGLPVSCQVERGPTVETILRVASRGHFDLVILAGVSGSSFRVNIMPGTAYRVLCGAPCPVLVIKEEAYRTSTRAPAA